jgi:hypothetical protein
MPMETEMTVESGLFLESNPSPWPAPAWAKKQLQALAKAGAAGQAPLYKYPIPVAPL